MFSLFEPYNEEYDLESYDEDKIAPLRNQGVLKLRRSSNDNYCTVNGEYNEGIAVLENLEGNGITQYIGFVENRKDEHGRGEVLYRISKDGGDTYEYYNESSDQWEEPTSNDDWVTAKQIDRYLPDLDMGIGREFKLKIKLVPGENQFGEKTFSPKLNTIVLFYEISMSIQVDVRRSIKRHFDEYFRPILKDTISLESPQDYVDYGDINFEIKEPVQVYNLTTDSDNIYDRIEGSRIYFESPQQGDIELIYHTKMPIYIGPSDEELKSAEIPSVLIQIPTMEEAREYLHWTESGMTETSRERGFARVRKKGPVPYRFTISVTLQSDFQLQTLPMSDETNRMFNTAHPDLIESEAGNRPYRIVQLIESIESNVEEESRVVNTSQFHVVGFDFSNQAIFNPDELGEEEIDVPLVKEVNLCLTDMEREFGEHINI